jgi:hypothetical protein
MNKLEILKELQEKKQNELLAINEEIENYTKNETEDTIYIKNDGSELKLRSNHLTWNASKNKYESKDDTELLVVQVTSQWGAIASTYLTLDGMKQLVEYVNGKIKHIEENN